MLWIGGCRSPADGIERRPAASSQTEVEARLEQTILDDALRYSKKLGMDRRTFLRTSGGMACAFLALNKVFAHPFYDVEEVEDFEPAAT